MPSRSPSQALRVNRHATLWCLWMAGTSALAAWSLASTPLAAASDRALVLTGLLALPIPAFVLNGLSQPPSWRLRQLLGESSRQTLSRGLTACGVILGACVVGALSLSLTLTLLGSFDLRAPCVMLTGVAGATIATVGLVSSSMRVIGVGTPKELRKLAGAGFGPAEMAPLLYAPAFGLAGGMVPAALLAAVWGAVPGAVDATLWLSATAGALAVLIWISRASIQRLQPEIQAAYGVITEAHRSPVAAAEELSQPPRWLRGEDAVDLWLARVWVRRYPASPWMTAGLLCLICFARPSAAGVTALAVGAVALYSGLRGRGLDSVGPSLTMLGVDPSSLSAAITRLCRRLMWPCVVTLPLLWWLGLWGGVGLLVGVMTAWALAAQLDAKKARVGQALALATVLCCVVWS